MIPDNEGAAVIVATVDVMAAAEDKTDTLETFVVPSEKARKRHLHLILLFTFH